MMGEGVWFSKWTWKQKYEAIVSCVDSFYNPNPTEYILTHDALFQQFQVIFKKIELPITISHCGDNWSQTFS